MADELDISLDLFTAEWRPQKMPLSAQEPVRSSYFEFQNTQCYLQLGYLYDSKDHRYSLHLIRIETGNETTLQLPLRITVCVFIDTYSFYFRKTVTDLDSPIWNCSLSRVKNHIPTCDFVQSNLNFRIIFQCDFDSSDSISGTFGAGQNVNPTYPEMHECGQACSGLETHSCLESFRSNLRTLLQYEHLDQDVYLQCEDHVISAHWRILDRHSTVFRAMLQSHMMESRTNFIQITDLNPSIFKVFLEYLYTEFLPILSTELAMQLYEIADFYDVAALKKKCAICLEALLTPNNVDQLQRLAEIHCDEVLQKSINCYKTYFRIPPYTDEYLFMLAGIF